MARITMNHIIQHLRLKLNDATPVDLTSAEQYAGDTIKLTGTYTNLNGTATDPTSPTVTVTDPNGTVQVDGEVPTQSATGIYFYDYGPIVAIDGQWRAKFAGTVSGNPTTWEVAFRVYTAPKYTWTDNELQAFLDLHRRRIYRKKLDSDPDEQVFEIGHTLLEGSTVSWSGSGDPEDVINIWDSAGSDATAKTPTSYNLVSGTFNFDSQQTIQPYYLDGLTYNINGAIAEAYEQIASDQGKAKSWSRGGVSYTYESFLDMAKRFRGLSGTDKGRLV